MRETTSLNRIPEIVGTVLIITNCIPINLKCKYFKELNYFSRHSQLLLRIIVEMITTRSSGQSDNQNVHFYCVCIPECINKEFQR